MTRTYRVGAVADTTTMTGADVRRVLAGSGIGDLLEVIVTSVDVGAAKPDRAGVRLAMRLLGVRPAETLFVGDAGVDEGAATNAGIRSLRFDAGSGSAPGLAETLVGDVRPS